MNKPRPPTKAEAPGGVAGSLLAALEAGGELVDEGGFSIDAAEALRKLREFQLADAHAYVLRLVEAAALGGADPIRLEIDASAVVIELGPIAFTHDELAELFTAVFIELEGASVVERRRRRSLQQLAFACNAALRLNPKAIEIESIARSGEGLRTILTPARELGEVEAFEPAQRKAGTRVRVRHSGLGVGAAEPREAELVRSSCVYSSRAVELGGERVSRGMVQALHVELLPTELSFSPRVRKASKIELDGELIGYAGLRYTSKAPAAVTILTNGVLAEELEFGDEERPGAPDFAAIVDVDLAKDLGQTKLLRGPEFERVMEAIWAVHDRVAPEGFGAPRRKRLVAIGDESNFITALIVLIIIGVALAAWGAGAGDTPGGLVVLFGIGLAVAGAFGLGMLVLQLRSER
ncbi:hypothetical protein ENSA5_05300 [Enhygromyxa salina]|uniref:Uncharacterized protein n=1 Tax=Enhygromyxa salina TaxID=215803 RepID=A0A2S9YI23_9BACT|nr:hypothetical protein [Enhygromyxa salina]PRQ04765.1 hypothetical protein ENSA5_05300 [Enhygromyxa salina]